MSAGLYSGVSGLALGTGLYKNVSGLWGGASGLIDGFAGTSPFSGASLYLNFLAGAPLDSRVTFSRGTNATLVDSTGKVTYAPANLLTYSQEIGGTNWLSDDVTVALNSIAAPNGTLTASTITDTVTNSDHRTISGGTNPSFTASVSYTLSVYVKNNTRNFVQLAFGTAAFGATAYANFDVTTGVVGTVGSGTTASITAVGSGWYRCAITAPATATASTSIFFALITSATAVRAELYAGTGSSLYVWGAQLEPVTYQTTPSTYNVTTTAAYYGPRFDYDPVTLAPKGLLIEEARTNLFTYSDQFDNAAWTKANATITANTTASPDGTTNADKLVEDTATSVHTVATGSITATANSFYAFTIYAKASGRDFIQINFSNLILSGNVWDVDLAANTITFVSAGAGWSNVAGSITNAGNGWRRISVSGQVGATISAVGVTVRLASSPSTISYTGNGTSGAFLYGAQLEAGAFATSYIPTVASQVTRSADVATMTGTNFSSWYNASEGSFVSSYEASPNTYTTYVAASNGVVAQNSMHMDNDGSGNMRVAYYSGSSAVALLTFGAVGTINAVNNIATAYKVNDFAASRNGGPVATDTAGAVPVGVNRLNIGADPSGAAVNVSNTHIRSIAYYNTRLPNAQLQALTAPSMVTTLSLDFINGVYDA